MRSWQFRALGVPVSVEPWFWLVALFLGASLPPPDLPLWIASVFFAVLVHEMGHAHVGRLFGLAPRIQLYAMGGLTSWAVTRRLPAWSSIWLSFAGPAAGFILGAALWAILALLPETLAYPWLRSLLRFGILINFVWGVLNLIPVLPLDGGNIMRSLVQLYVLRPAPELPLQISVGVGAVVSLYGLVTGQWFLAVLFGWLGYLNYMELQRSLR